MTVTTGINIRKTGTKCEKLLKGKCEVDIHWLFYSGVFWTFFSFLLVNMISFLDFKLELYVAELITLISSCRAGYLICFNYKCLKNLLWKTSLNPLFFPFSSFLSFISFSIFFSFFLSFISFILFDFLPFHSLALSLGINLPPAGKLHTFGYTWHTLSSVLQIITLPSQTTSSCMDASRTSTSIRSKHYLERGTYSWVMNESFNMNCFCCASMEVEEWRFQSNPPNLDSNR